MERDGLITRLDYATNPPHVEYELTDLGRSLMRLIDAMREWSREHLPELLANRTRYGNLAPDLAADVKPAIRHSQKRHT
ncbi:winged helix-turn-helix transcriptional regulator [Nocardia brasiliensis]|uniref:winged helix-turn-helix transcriptional regulator n=1 Tax=Nocardia brasiliensis TaxID=37326 RepID=UPI003CC7EE5F